MPTLLLTAIGGSGRETGLGFYSQQGMVVKLILVQDLKGKQGGEEDAYIAFSANHFVAVVFARESLERWLNDAASKTEDEMEG